MAEKHIAVASMNSVEAVFYEIYNFINTYANNNCGVRWADNDVTHAVSCDGATYSVPANAAGVGDGSFMVIESESVMPSGRRWQVRITVDTAGDDIDYQFAPRGGWDYINLDYGATVGTWNGAGYPFSGWAQCNLGASPSNNTLYMSISNLETYGSENIKCEYFRFLLRNAALAEGSQFREGIYVGGYIPFDPVGDTNPVVALSRIPAIATAVYSWGYVTLGTSNLNRIAPDIDGSTINLNTSYAMVAGASFNGFAAGQEATKNTRSGQWVNTPLWIIDLSNYAMVGYTGKYSQLLGNKNRDDAAADASLEYLVVNDLMMRWKPSA